MRTAGNTRAAMKPPAEMATRAGPRGCVQPQRLLAPGSSSRPAFPVSPPRDRPVASLERLSPVTVARPRRIFTASVERPLPRYLRRRRASSSGRPRARPRPTLAGMCRFLYFGRETMGNLWRLLEWIGLALGVVIAGTAMAFLLTRRRIMRTWRGSSDGRSSLLATGARVGSYDHLANGKTISARGRAHAPHQRAVLPLLAGVREVFVPGLPSRGSGVRDARAPERAAPHRGALSQRGRQGRTGSASGFSTPRSGWRQSRPT